MKAGDWLGRVGVLVLSGLATFSILGSLVTASRMPTGEDAPRVAAVEPAAESSGTDAASGSGVGRGMVADEKAASGATPMPVPEGGQLERVPVSRDAGEVARWLEALTYAVLALAGFAAAALLALLRCTGHLARIADASQRRSASQR